MYTPMGGYGSQVGKYNFAQTPQGGTWSTVPQSQASGGRVLGAETTAAPKTPSNTNNRGGGSSSGGSSSGSDFLKQIDDVFSSNEDYLKKAAKTVQSQQSGIESDINSLFQSNVESLGAQRAESEGQLMQQEQAGAVRREDALSAARRLYNELLAGGQQRFGGASSAGQAYGELAGRELQQNTAQIARDYENFSQQIGQARQNIQAQYTNALQTLETRKASAMNEARRAFQNTLLEIDRLRSQSNEAKASAKLSALQDLRNQMYQINLSSAQARQNVDSLAMRLGDELSAYEGQMGYNVNQGQGAQQAFNQAAPTQFQTDYSYSGMPQQQQTGFTGQITTPRQEDEFSFA